MEFIAPSDLKALVKFTLKIKAPNFVQIGQWQNSFIVLIENFFCSIILQKVAKRSNQSAQKYLKTKTFLQTPFHSSITIFPKKVKTWISGMCLVETGLRQDSTRARQGLSCNEK